MKTFVLQTVDSLLTIEATADLEIDTPFKLDGTTYITIQHPNSIYQCQNCAFNSTNSYCSNIACAEFERTDRKYVRFQKVE